MGRGEQRQEHLGRGWAWSRGQAAVLAVSRFSPVPFFMTPWTLAHQAPVSMGFSRQEYWSGLPFPPPGGNGSCGGESTFLLGSSELCLFFFFFFKA